MSLRTDPVVTRLTPVWCACCARAAQSWGSCALTDAEGRVAAVATMREHPLLARLAPPPRAGPGPLWRVWRGRGCGPHASPRPSLAGRGRPRAVARQARAAADRERRPATRGAPGLQAQQPGHATAPWHRLRPPPSRSRRTRHEDGTRRRPGEAGAHRRAVRSLTGAWSESPHALPHALTPAHRLREAPLVCPGRSWGRRRRRLAGMAVPSLRRRDSTGPSRLRMPCSHAGDLLDARRISTTIDVAWRTCMAPLSHQATFTQSALSDPSRW